MVWLGVSGCIDSLDMVYEGDLRLEEGVALAALATLVDFFGVAVEIEEG